MKTPSPEIKKENRLKSASHYGRKTYQPKLLMAKKKRLEETLPKYQDDELLANFEKI